MAVFARKGAIFIFSYSAGMPITPREANTRIEFSQDDSIWFRSPQQLNSDPRAHRKCTLFEKVIRYSIAAKTKLNKSNL